jgi:hypothetical protein
VPIDLRERLLEVPGALLTVASLGVEERPVRVGRITGDSHDALGLDHDALVARLPSEVGPGLGGSSLRF